ASRESTPDHVGLGVGELHHNGPPCDGPSAGEASSLEPPLAFPMPFQGLRTAPWLRLTFLPFLFALAATVAVTFLLALLTASTRTRSSPVALGEDHLTPQRASLVTSGDAAGKDLAFLGGTPSSS